MDAKSFWLVVIDRHTVFASLISLENQRYSVRVLGQEFPWATDSPDSFTQSLDKSLSSASSLADLSEDDEPNESVFIVSPFWVGPDGKIINSYLKLIESSCKLLDLQPMGFIADDEAITEAIKLKEGLPVSFILLHLNPESFNLSLVYLGKVKQRLHQEFNPPLSVSQIENALLELNSEATLPPQIVIFGYFTEDQIQSIKDYPWIGKKNLETFLHLPDIETYSREDLVNVYSRTVIAQMEPGQPPLPSDQISPEDEDKKNNQEIVQTETPEVVEENNHLEEKVVEVTAQDLGFFTPPPPQSKTSWRLPRLPSLPKIKIPRLHLPVIIFAAFPLLILIPFFLSSATITLFLTPYQFDKSITVILDPESTTIDPVKKIIPVETKETIYQVSQSIPTTGRKTTGEKAQGEIALYNKQEKIITLSSKSILTDPSGKKFELATSVSVPPSNYNLEQGILTLGQAKAVAIAADIGPEFNIGKDVKISSKDYSDVLIVRTTRDFTGGSRREVNVVSQTDKTNLANQIKQSFQSQLDDIIKQKFGNTNGLIKGSLRSEIGRIDYQREISEEVDQLEASAEAQISVFVLNPSLNGDIIKSFLSDDESFAQSSYDPDKFQINFQIDRFEKESAAATLKIQGTTLPRIDTDNLRRQLAGKSRHTASKIIRNFHSRLYDFHLNTNFQFLGKINPLPFRFQRISIELKEKSP